MSDELLGVPTRIRLRYVPAEVLRPLRVLRVLEDLVHVVEPERPQQQPLCSELDALHRFAHPAHSFRERLSQLAPAALPRRDNDVAARVDESRLPAQLSLEL